MICGSGFRSARATPNRGAAACQLARQYPPRATGSVGLFAVAAETTPWPSLPVLESGGELTRAKLDQNILLDIGISRARLPRLAQLPDLAHLPEYGMIEWTTWGVGQVSVEEVLRGIRQRRERLDAALARILPQLISLGAVKVILFGSLVEGRTHEYSDLDLLVIMPPTRAGKDWADLIYGSIERGVASDLVVYNTDEYKEMLPRSSFLRGIEASGRIVYDAGR